MPLTMVLPDANVLVSKTTRDWLFLLAQECQGMFTVHYTVDIMVETLRTVRRQNPTLDGAAITALMKKIEESSRSRLDEYPADPGYPGSDPHDQHIHAAAKHHGINKVLTGDHQFARIDPDLLPYEVWTCDDFFVLVDDGNPDAVVKVAAKQMLYWIGKDGRSLPDALIAASCPQFAERLRAHISSDEVLRTLAQELA